MKKKYTLRYNKHNADMRRRMDEIYYIWDHVSVSLARNILKKMYLGEFNEIIKVSDKRLILHNLILAEMKSEKHVTNSAKKWSKELVDFLKNESEYIEINVEEYAKALNNYLYTNEYELNDNEKIEIYKLYYKAFEQYEYVKGGSENEIKKYLDKMNAKFNINLLKRNFNTLIEIFNEVLIHNNNSDCVSVLNYFLKDVQDINPELYNQMLLLLQNDNKLSKIS